MHAYSISRDFFLYYLLFVRVVEVASAVVQEKFNYGRSFIDSSKTVSPFDSGWIGRKLLRSKEEPICR